MLNWLCLYFFSTLERCFSHSFKKRKTEIIVTIVISLLDLKVFKWCFVFFNFIPGGPGGANRPLPAEHSRVHHAAGSSSQNLSGWGHQAASESFEEHGQRCTGEL